MNLVKKFRKSDDYEKMGALVSGMRNMVVQFSDEQSTLVSQADWKGFITSLVESREEQGYWTVASKPESLESDDLVEFQTFPTAIALAALSRDQILFPGELDEKACEIFQESAAAFQLQGFGEDNLFQVCEILLIFLEGGLPVLLNMQYHNNPLLAQLKGWQREFHRRLKERNTRLAFGGDYAPIFKLILSGLNDELGEP